MSDPQEPQDYSCRHIDGCLNCQAIADYFQEEKITLDARIAALEADLLTAQKFNHAANLTIDELQAEPSALKRGPDDEAAREALENLKAVLCDTEGKCCIAGSHEDRMIVDESLEAISASCRKAWAQADQHREGAIHFSGLVAGLQAEVERLRAALIEEHAAGHYVAENVGVHPEAWIDGKNPENSYSKRTPEMQEHNEKVVRYMKARVATEKALSQKPCAECGGTGEVDHRVSGSHCCFQPCPSCQPRKPCAECIDGVVRTSGEHGMSDEPCQKCQPSKPDEGKL